MSAFAGSGIKVIYEIEMTKYESLCKNFFMEVLIESCSQEHGIH